jgi:hypothetical protein
VNPARGNAIEKMARNYSIFIADYSDDGGVTRPARDGSAGLLSTATVGLGSLLAECEST